MRQDHPLPPRAALSALILRLRLPFATLLDFLRSLHQRLHITFRLPIRINPELFIRAQVLLYLFQLQLLSFGGLLLYFGIGYGDHLD
jgi:hypothetical protein